MKKILISYGDKFFENSLNRVAKEAKQLNIFDKIILYHPSDLPEFIKANPLMAFKKGGGYWMWKPYIIWKTLQDFKCATVVYVDAGCNLNKSDEWDNYFNEILNYETIVFNYRKGINYGWAQNYNCDSPAIKYWSKKSTLEYFDKLFQCSDWKENDKIMGGFIIAKNSDNNLINAWLQTSLFFPNLIIDPIGNELKNQEDFYVSHRHDQSILTPLVYYWKDKNNKILILEETAESAIVNQNNNVAVVASRNRDYKNPTISFKTRIIWIVKFFLGNKIYNLLHGYK